MIIPKLEKSPRSREYNSYSNIQCSKVVKAFLFDGKSNRAIDEETLGLNAEHTKGWRFMGILHYLGLRKEFKGIFSELTVEQGIEELKKSSDEDYSQIIALLLHDESYYATQDDIESELQDNYEVHTEGKKVQIYTTRYERNPVNRSNAIKIHGKKCMACGFDFEETYGETGKDYIEVHHVVPLSSIDEEVTVNPRTDLIVLCSNCHRMVHRRKNQVLTLDELIKIINKGQE